MILLIGIKWSFEHVLQFTATGLQCLCSEILFSNKRELKQKQAKKIINKKQKYNIAAKGKKWKKKIESL